MEVKKEMIDSFVQDAIKNMDRNSSQKPVNIQTNSDSSYTEKLMNANKSGINKEPQNNAESQKAISENLHKLNKTTPKVYSAQSNPYKEDINNSGYVKWFSELNNEDVAVAGGKGASLSEMYNAKFPVPPGFVITAQAFDFFITANNLKEQIKAIIETIDMEDTQELAKRSSEIRELIENSEMSKELEEEILEAYHILGSEEISSHISEDALNILKNSQEPIFVSVRSSATTEDLAEASFAGQQESFLNIKGDRNLIGHVKRCFSSLYTSRAIYYRDRKGFKEGALLAVVVQEMVDSLKSGVVFSKDPINLTDDIVIEAVYGLGEGIVSGRINPDHYLVSKDLKIRAIKIADKKIAIVRTSSGSNEIARLNYERSRSQVLTNAEILEVADYAIKLEKYYGKPQDIEFAIEDHKVYIVQSRPITTLKKEVKPKATLSGNVLLEGLGSSPGIGVGTVKIIKSIEDLPKIKKGDVLVTKMTNPDMVVTMQKSAAIVTDEGGMTAHASIVSREMGIPAVVGTGNATSTLKDGMKITVDGFNGKIYEGKVSEVKAAEIKPAFETNRIKLKIILDLPDFAERAAESKIDSIGLLRLEGIITSSGKHPLLYEKEDRLDDYAELLRKGIEKITEPFNSAWIRASDIRTDEYSSLKGAPEREINPMLGFHGVRFSLKHLKILEAELKAIKQVAEKNPNKKFGIMFPQIISIEEVKQTKEIFNKIKTGNMQFGVMVETPAAVQIIEDICKEVDFISFGTNDLTQFTLAVDRGNDDVQYLYNELHPAVLSQIKRVLGFCRRNRVETSICGQAGSKKEMVDFLFKRGINSISVNADAAYEISSYIRELEQKREQEIEGKKQEIEQEKGRRQQELQKQKEHQRQERGQEERQELQDTQERHKESEQYKRKWRKFKKRYHEYGIQQKNQQKDMQVGGAETSEKLSKQSGLPTQDTDKSAGEPKRFLDKSKVKIYAEPERIFEDSYEENIGPIEPFDNINRIEDESEQIKEEIEKEKTQELKKHKEIEDDIEVSGREVHEEEKKTHKETKEKSQEKKYKEDSISPADFEDIGVYNPDTTEEKQTYSYNFDDDL